MSSKKTTGAFPDLTPPELAVMQALWRDRTLSAREVHERVGEAEGWAYTTTRTVTERLAGRGLVQKRRLHGLIVYEPAVSRAEGLARRFLDFADRVLQVDRAQLVSMLGRSRALGPKDMAELERLLESAERPAQRGRR